MCGLLTGATFVSLVLHAAGPVTTNDLFWHVKTGEHLWRVGGFPERDVFSYTTDGLEWVLHEWLTQLIFFGLHETGGFPLLRVFTGIFAAVALWQVLTFARRHLADRGLVVVVCLAFAGLAANRFQTRPTLFSMALLLFEIGWLLRLRPPFGPRQSLLVLALIVGWVNLHSVGLLGVVVFGTYALGRFGQALIGAPDAPSARERAWILGTGVSALAVSCLNPSGWHLYAFAFQDKSLVMNYIVDEWGAFHLSYGRNPTLTVLAYGTILGILATVLAATFATGVVLNRVERRSRHPLFPDPLHLSMLALTLSGGLMARRFHWLLAISLVPALAQLRRVWQAAPWGPCQSHASGQQASPQRASHCRRSGAALLVLLHVFDLRYENRPLLANVAQRGYFTRSIAPSLDLPGIQFLRRTGLEGEAFCHYGSGGMLSYFLHPRVRVFIDSRVDLYRRDVFLDFLRVRDGHPDQQEILDRYGTDLYYRHWEIAPLRAPEQWTSVYRGPDGEIFLRKGPRTRENLARVGRLGTPPTPAVPTPAVPTPTSMAPK